MPARNSQRNFRVNFGNLTDRDIAANIHRAVRTHIGRRQNSHVGEQSLIRSGINAAASVAPDRMRTLSEMAALSEPPIATMTRTASPRLSFARPSGEFTVSLGPVATASTVVTVGISGGVYVWIKSPTPEIGLFGSGSVGVSTAIGVGGGGCLSFLFGAAPAVLAGDSLAIEVDISAGPIAYAGGVLYLSMTSPNAVIGFGVAVGAGRSLIPMPVTFSVSASTTWITAGTPLAIPGIAP